MKSLFLKDENTHWSIMLFRGALVALAVIGIIAALDSKAKSSVRNLFFKPYRKVLSTVSGDLLGKGKYYKVIKIETDDGLYIEIYGQRESEQHRSLIDKFKLPDRRDGYFQFQNRATNLAIDDIDEDRVLEILVPSYDEQMIAHLNVYRYSFSRQKFELMPPEFLEQFAEQLEIE